MALAEEIQRMEEDVEWCGKGRSGGSAVRRCFSVPCVRKTLIDTAGEVCPFLDPQSFGCSSTTFQRLEQNLVKLDEFLD